MLNCRFVLFLSFRTDIVSFYKDGVTTPYYAKGIFSYSGPELLDILVLNVDDERVCVNRPLAVQENAVFVINRACLKSPDDWLQDDHGSFENKGHSGIIVTTSDEDGVYTERLPRRKQERRVLEEGQYLVKTTYWTHRKYKDFKRKTVEVTNWKNEVEPLGMVQYFFEDEPHYVSPKKHGNAKGGKRFYPTSRSTKNNIIKKVCSHQGPTKIYDQAFQDAGGMLAVKAVSDLPRNTRQVKYERSKLRQKTEVDELASFLDKSRNSSWIQNTQWTPCPRAVIASKGLLEDVVNNCCNPEKFGVFSIDTTYNVGDFYVTSTVYPHIKLESRSTGAAPYLPGPAMLHVKQDESQFVYFGHTLIEKQPGMDGVLFIGLDRSKAQENGLARVFHVSRFLPCTKHVRDNVNAKLTSLQLTEGLKREIIKDIFGDDKRMEKGLIDSDSPEEFDCKLLEAQRRWDSLESMEKMGADPGFSKYFTTCVADSMREGMITPIRKAAGLGDNLYFNNASESFHFQYKLQIEQNRTDDTPSGKPNLKSTMSQATDEYVEMCERAARNVERAVIDEGPYRLAPEFQHLKKTTEEWIKMSEKEKKDHLKKISPLSQTALDEETELPMDEETAVLGNFNESGLPEMFKASWRNAEVILKEDGVGQAPGSKTNKVVMSTTSDSLHLVRVTDRKLPVCDCEGFKHKGLCSHVLAVSFQMGSLQRVLSDWTPNITRQLQESMPSGAGLKENEKGRKRTRKTHREERSTAGFSERVPSVTPTIPPDEYQVVFVKNTKALTCYGCGSKVIAITT